jgi:putative sterol carrier protein
VPRFLSPEWAEAFDAAVHGVTVPSPGEEAGLAALGGTFTVVQEVRGAPDGDVTVVLKVENGALRLSLEPGTDGEDGTRGDVAISLSYEDAASLSKGELVAAVALTEGRIRVRGDLSVLVASQQMLAAAQPYVQSLTSATTY